MPKGLLGSIALLLVWFGAGRAMAFECTAVPQCPINDFACVEPEEPVLTQAWTRRTLPYWIRTNDPLFGQPGMEALVRRAFDEWSANVACTDLRFVFSGYADEGARFDERSIETQRNMILSAEDPAILAEFSQDPTLLALTLTSFIVPTGEILDADIVFNIGLHAFETVDDFNLCIEAPAGQRPFDIENTLVHEIGHFIGFDHVVDRQATMFANAAACETRKRDLAEDDREGVCTVYPAGGPTSPCAPPDSYDVGSGGGCRSQSPTGNTGTGLILALLGFGMGARVLKRKRMSASEAP